MMQVFGNVYAMESLHEDEQGGFSMYEQTRKEPLHSAMVQVKTGYL